MPPGVVVGFSYRFAMSVSRERIERSTPRGCFVRFGPIDLRIRVYAAGSLALRGLDLPGDSMQDDRLDVAAIKMRVRGSQIGAALFSEPPAGRSLQD
jgi:hypothetical protein